MLKIAVASGKGGTGKTFVSTNLYHTMKTGGKRVALVDCDAEVPNSALFVGGEQLAQWSVQVFCPSIDLDRCTRCGACAEMCFAHAITCIPSLGYIKVMRDLCHACTACHEVCPEAAIIPGTKEIGVVTAYGNDGTTTLFEARIKEGEHSPVPVIREAIRHAELEHCDLLVFDAPPGCACPFVNTVKEADVVVLVTEPTPFGLSDLKHTVEVLRHLDKPFCVLINRADMGDGQMKKYLEEEHILILAELPYSEQIAAAYSKGNLAVLTDEHLKYLFEEMSHKILQYENSHH